MHKIFAAEIWRCNEFKLWFFFVMKHLLLWSKIQIFIKHDAKFFSIDTHMINQMKGSQKITGSSSIQYLRKERGLSFES